MLSLRRDVALNLLPLLLLTGCAWFEQSAHERIIGDYEVGWNDLIRNRNISKPDPRCSGCYQVLVDGYVYAVGHNERFIRAKQHYGPDTITQYFIIDIAENQTQGGDGIYGPLSAATFTSLSNKLRIADLPFDQLYPENP